MKKVKTLLIVCVVALSGCSGPKNLIHTTWVNVSTSVDHETTRSVNRFIDFEDANRVNVFASIIVGSDIILEPTKMAQGTFKYDNGDVVNKKSLVEVMVVDFENQQVNYSGKFKNKNVLELQNPTDLTVVTYQRYTEKLLKKLTH